MSELEIAIGLEEIIGTLQRRYPQDEDAGNALQEVQQLVDQLDVKSQGSIGTDNIMQGWGSSLAFA